MYFEALEENIKKLVQGTNISINKEVDVFREELAEYYKNSEQAKPLVNAVLTNSDATIKTALISVCLKNTIKNGKNTFA